MKESIWNAESFQFIRIQNTKANNMLHYKINIATNVVEWRFCIILILQLISIKTVKKHFFLKSSMLKKLYQILFILFHDFI